VVEILPYSPEEDRAAVEAVVRAGLRDQERYAAQLTPPEDQGFMDEWLRRLAVALERGPEGCWVAMEQGRVVGFMWTSLVREWPFPYMTVDQLDVLPEYRGRGIGRKLLDQAVLLARARPIPLLIGGLITNPALRLSRRAGFVDLPDCIREDRNPNHFVLWWRGTA
jgi:ribosomal protein S18 acetylase RimI-like enzyme